MCTTACLALDTGEEIKRLGETGDGKTETENVKRKFGQPENLQVPLEPIFVATYCTPNLRFRSCQG
jgi:hypothetical protein